MDKIKQNLTENDVIQRSKKFFFNPSVNPFNDQLVTRIHDKYYDLSDFNHPGGPVAISLIVNRDGTELFESHHLFSKKDIEKILSKYEMLLPPNPSISASNVYNWKLTKSSDFTKELKAMAKEEIGSDLKCTWSRLLELAVIFVVTLSQVFQFYEGYWHTLFTLPLAYWILVVNLFHDASHFGLSWNWRINRLATNVGIFFSAPYTWYHQHVIGHHCYPNIIGKDPDLYHSRDLARHSLDVKFKAAHSFQAVTFVYIWLVAVQIGLIWHGMIESYRMTSYNKVVTFGNSKYLNPKSLFPRFLAYFFLVHVLSLVLHGVSVKGVLFAVIPIYFFSLFFMISTQINHLTPETTDQLDENFYIHQIKTSHNVATDSYLLFLFTGGLNMQIEHHLFPSLNHCHLKKLIPRVKELCKKYEVKYSESRSLWNALCQHVTHLRRYSLKE